MSRLKKGQESLEGRGNRESRKIRRRRASGKVTSGDFRSYEKVRRDDESGEVQGQERSGVRLGPGPKGQG